MVPADLNELFENPGFLCLTGCLTDYLSLSQSNNFDEATVRVR